MKAKMSILSKMLFISSIVCVIFMQTAFGQGNTLKLDGNNNVAVDSKIGSINNADLNIITNNTLRLKISKTGSVKVLGDLEIIGKLKADSLVINRSLTADSIHVRSIRIGDNSLYLNGSQIGPNGTMPDLITSSYGQISFGNSGTFDNIQVGIGTTNPQNTFDVFGEAVIGSGYAGNINVNAPVNGLLVEGKVGVGTTSTITGVSLNVLNDINVGDTKGYRINGTIVLQNPGGDNIYVGQYAGVNPINEGSDNSFVGSYAGFSNTTGNWNSFIGSDAGFKNTEGKLNTFIGFTAGYLNTIGNWNSFIGAQAGRSNISGSFNSYIGNSAGFLNTDGSYNAFLGTMAGFSNTIGNYNSFFGNVAGYFNTTGNENSFFGNDAGYFNTTGNENSFFGSSSGFKNNIGASNSFFGGNSGMNNNSGSNNSFIGYGAGIINTSGSNNSFFGYRAGTNNTIGNNNTYLGYQAGASGNFNNATAIGANATVGASDCMVLGNNVNVGIGVTAPTAKLEINNNGTANPSGLKFTSLTSAYNPIPTVSKALTVDENGNVILANVVGIMPPPTIPDPPTLNLPADGADVFREDVGLNLFSWYAVANGCYYSVYISSSNDPTDETAIVYKQTTTDTYILSYLTVATGTTYYWWVKALNGCQTGNISEIRSFNYQILPEPPKLIPSDSIFKTNITPLTDALVKTLQLNGKYFNWNTVDYPSFNDTTRNIGLIAQEVQPIIPEVVKADAQGHLFMNYSQLVPVLIEAVKELNTKNTTLTTVTDSLKTVIANYETRFANIEAMLSNCCQNTGARLTQGNSSDNSSVVSHPSSVVGHQSLEYDNTEISSVIHITPDNSINSPVTELYQNRPNPFTTKTTFTYQLGKTGFVELEIHSELGAFVAKLVDMNQQEGSFSIDWNTNDIAPGIYFYSLKVDGQLWVKKAVRIK